MAPSKAKIINKYNGKVKVYLNNLFIMRGYAYEILNRLGSRMSYTPQLSPSSILGKLKKP